jgi:hypothetical protein
MDIERPMKHGKRTRVRILYVILLILIGITVVPLWFYGSKMMSMNRERLETQESVLQTITSQSLSQVISLYMDNLNQQLKEFFDTVGPLAMHIPSAKYATDPDLRVALEGFVADRPAVLYATVLNDQARLMPGASMLPATLSCTKPWNQLLPPPNRGRSIEATPSPY